MASTLAPGARSLSGVLTASGPSLSARRTWISRRSSARSTRCGGAWSRSGSHRQSETSSGASSGNSRHERPRVRAARVAAMAKRKAKAEQPDIKAPQVERKPDGKFAKGVSGCPGGKPAIARVIRDLAQADSPEAYAKVRAIMQYDGHKHQLAAALAVLKVAGVPMNAGDAPQPPVPSPPSPYSAKPTADLLKEAGVSSTLPN